MATRDLIQKFGNVSVILGGQWGDEGKGKLIDIMAEQYDIVARATGGANAGHTVYVPDPVNENGKKKFIFHLMPSGVLYPNVIGVIGNGVVLHIPTLFEEIEFLKTSGVDISGRLFISDRAHLLFEYHKIVDGIQEERKGKNMVGTTRRGIGPAYAEKIGRTGIRVHELLDFERFENKLRQNVANLAKAYDFEFDAQQEIDYYRKMLPEIKPLITDTSYYLNKAIKDGKKVLIEGANGTLLDVDHGTFPFVTSSNASIGGAIAGSGVAPNKITAIIGIMKAYCTRVGAGPFPTEQDNEIGEKIRQTGGEFGSTTGRPRRCGWFDAVASKYSAQLNGMTSINLTKLDILDNLDVIKIGVAYEYNGKTLQSFPADAEVLENLEVKYIEMPGWKQDISGARKIADLPENARKYVQKIEELLECPVDFVGVGVSRDQMAEK
ncbi:adenylosuccinate synthase [Patescibacteria group bacterium]|nr:adenylosuccinate synthase [Patescibacteria group bacterium]MBU1702812.1 adenylosuccinate synthase [Patescibacteria group bacterium]MBU1953795.1 adenylosuccinate synthase [Patescibacteria group bacterium]